MKIIKNTSVYETKKLNTLFCFIHNLIAKHEGRLRRWSMLKIHVKKHSRSYSGCANLGVPNYVDENIPHMTLRMHRDLSLNEIAQLFAHELMHSYGYDHHQFNTDPLTNDELNKIANKFNKDELLSAKANHVPKKGISYKQQCLQLLKVYHWLTIDELPLPIEGRFCLETWDMRCDYEESYTIRSEHLRSYSWKGAYDNALELITEEIQKEFTENWTVNLTEDYLEYSYR